MARPQQRRADRNARQSQSVTAQETASSYRAAAVRLLADTQWEVLTATLQGLLSTEFPTSFTDLEQSPDEAWLVVHLTRVHAHANLRHQIVRVLNALTQLLVLAETLRPCRDLYDAFWLRVLTSEMRVGRGRGAKIPGFIRFVNAHGTHVAFEWRGRRLDANSVLDPLHRWLAETVVDASSVLSAVPVRLALRFEDCQLTLQHIEHMEKLLTIPAEATQDKVLVCEAPTLCELSLNGNMLDAPMLQQLAFIVQDPLTRRIDALNLDRMIPTDAHHTETHSIAFGLLLTTVMEEKPASHPSVRGVDQGVALSLQDWTIVDTAYITAIANVMQQATRPLRALSLANWKLTSPHVMDEFDRRLILSRYPLPTAIPGFHLDVTNVRSAATHG